MNSFVKRNFGWGGLLGLACFCGGGAAAWSAAKIDESKLPPPATNQIEFVRDIKPILEKSCLKCHGPERPKSNFRIDARAGAMKGGENGVDIVPGQSAKSPLIHYVARLVEDMEMPPPGKGEPLTPEQVGLLRAWIDQDKGQNWSLLDAPNKTEFSSATALGWISVSGNERVFREHYWQREGWGGGLERFELREQTGPESTVTVKGRALRDDYGVTLTLEKKNVGFARFGFDQYRKYYSDSGGYYPALDPSIFRLDRDLYLDVGKAWVDFGLTLPHWPRMTVGYEYQYKDGEKSTLQWGSVTQGTEPLLDPLIIDARTRNIYPASKTIREDVHVLRFDLDHEIGGVRIEDTFRGEFYDSKTARDNLTYVPGAGSMTSTRIQEGQDYFRGANSIRLEKQFTSWFLGSGGYLFSKLNADSTFALTPQVISGPALFLEDMNSQRIILGVESHIFNLNALWGPWEGLTLTTGVQSEWTRQEGMGSATLNLVPPGGAAIPFPLDLRSDLDKSTVDENAALRYTRIPFTVLFGEARLQQESVGHFEEQAGGIRDFLRNTDETSRLRDFRFGFNTSPWQRVSFGSHYRARDKQTSYDHLTDESFGAPNEGYSAFIRAREVYSDEVEARVVVRPANWLKTTFTYRLVASDFRTETDPVPGALPDDISPGGWILAGVRDANVYSFNAVITPFRRMYLSTTCTLQDTRTETKANNSPYIVPYRGDVYSWLSSANFVLNEKTDLHLSYYFSYADYGQSGETAGLPLGIQYQRHGVQAGISRSLAKYFKVRLQYGFYYYDEPSSGTINNYTGHSVFATVTMKWP